MTTEEQLAATITWAIAGHDARTAAQARALGRRLAHELLPLMDACGRAAPAAGSRPLTAPSPEPSTPTDGTTQPPTNPPSPRDRGEGEEGAGDE